MNEFELKSRLFLSWLSGVSRGLGQSEQGSPDDALWSEIMTTVDTVIDDNPTV